MLMMANRQPESRPFYIDGHDRQRVNSVKAAEIAGVTVRTIYNWVRLGWVEFERTPGGGVRIYVDTLLIKR